MRHWKITVLSTECAFVQLPEIIDLWHQWFKCAVLDVLNCSLHVLIFFCSKSKQNRIREENAWLTCLIFGIFFLIKIYPLVEHLVWIVAAVVDFGICFFCLLVTHWKTFPLSHEAEDQASFTEENDKDESPLLNQVQGFAHVKLNRNWSIARVSPVSTVLFSTN